MISHALAKCVEPQVLEELISYVLVARPAQRHDGKWFGATQTFVAIGSLRMTR